MAKFAISQEGADAMEALQSAGAVGAMSASATQQALQNMNAALGGSGLALAAVGLWLRRLGRKE